MSKKRSLPEIETADQVSVVTRLRILNEREKKNNCKIRWESDPDINCIKMIENESKFRSSHRQSHRDSYLGKKGQSNKTFTFDKVYGPENTTKSIYKSSIRPIVQKFCDGFNGTVIAYGQTGSGKTYTMSNKSVGDTLGIIPSAVKDIFRFIDASKSATFMIRVQYIEIYKEKITDLLSDTSLPQSEYKFHNDNYNNTLISNVTELNVEDYNQILSILDQGTLRRSQAKTNMNEHSSRSHAIFKIILDSNENNVNMISHLNLVDLAGSEKVSDTGASGERLLEANAINKSLSTLTLVISQISEKNSHVSYRDSKLTMLLKSSLGGNAQTCILICASPADAAQTQSSLQFGTRAKKIENHVKQNKEIDPAKMKEKFDEMDAELNRLRKNDKQNEQDRIRLSQLERFVKNMTTFHNIVENDSRDHPKSAPNRRRTCVINHKIEQTGSDPQDIANIFADFKNQHIQKKNSRPTTPKNLDESLNILNDQDQKILALETEVDEKDEEIAALKQEIKCLKETETEITQQIGQLQAADKDKLSRTLGDELLETCEQTELEKEKLEAEISKLKYKLMEANYDKKELEHEFSIQKTRIQKLEAKCAEREEMSFIRHENEVEAEEKFDEEIKAYKINQEKLEVERELLEKENLKLRNRIEQIRSLKRSTSDEQFQEQESTPIANSEEDTIKLAEKFMKEECNRKRLKLEQESLYEQFKKECLVKDTELSILQSQLKTVTTKFDENIDSLKSEIRGKEKIIEFLEAQKSELASSIDNLQREHSVELSVLQNCKTSLEKDVVDANEKLKSIELCHKEQIDLLEAKLNDIKLSRNELENELRCQETQSQMVLKDDDDKDLEINKLKEKIKNLMSEKLEIADREKRMAAENEQEKSHLTLRIEDLENENKRIVSDLNIKIENDQLQIKSLRDRCNDDIERFAAAETEITALHQKLDENKSELENSKIQISVLSEEKLKYENETTSLQSKIEKLVSDLADSHSKIDSLNSVIADKNSRIENAEEMLVKKEFTAAESVQKLENEIETLAEEKKALFDKNENYKKEIQEKDEIIDASKIDVKNLKLSILEFQKQFEGSENHENVKRELIMERDSAIKSLKKFILKGHFCVKNFEKII